MGVDVSIALLGAAHFRRLFPSPHIECASPSLRAFCYDPDMSNVTMNILENQVTDLTYLADSPIAISGMSGPRQSSSAESPVAATNGGTKRTADESTGNTAAQTRAKRNRYISIAW